MKAKYKFWVYASIEVEVDGNAAMHQLLNNAISDDDITLKLKLEHAALVMAGQKAINDIEVDWSNLIGLSKVTK